MAYDIGTARGLIEIDYDGSGVKKAQDDVAGLTESGKKAGMSVDDIGKNAGRAGLVIAAGLGAGVAAAANFEQRMSAIEAVSGATASEMDALSGKALQLGKDTSFSAGEAASAMEELIKAGLPIEDVLNGAADATVNLAAAGEVDLKTAATIASNAMNQFNLSAEDMTGVVDNIAGAANASAIDVTDFGTSLAQVGAVANLAGVDFKDTATAIAIMGNAGIKGSDAGTSLKTMLSRLQPTTKAQYEEMERLGLISFDTNKAMETLADNGIKGVSRKDAPEALKALAAELSDSEVGSAKAQAAFTKLGLQSGALSNQFFKANGETKGMAQISGTLAKSLEGLDKRQKSAALQVLFGSDAIRAAAVMADAGAKGFNKMAESMGKVSAADVAKTRLDNFKGSLEAMKGSLETVGIAVGTVLLPPLRKIVDAAAELLNKFLNLDAGTQKVIVGAAAAAAAILLLVAAFIKIMQFARALQAALVTLRAIMATTWIAALGPIALIIAAIAAVVAIVVLLWKKNDTFRNAIIAAWNAIKAGVAAVVNWFTGTLIPAFQKIWDSIKSGLSTLKGVMVSIWNAIKSAVTSAINGVKNVITSVVNAIKSVWSRVWNTVKTIATAIWNAIKAVIQREINGIKTIVTTVVNAVKAVWTTVWNAIKAVVTTVWNGIKSVVSTSANALKNLVMGPINTLKGLFSAAWNQIKSTLTTAMNNMKTAVTNGINNVVNTVRGLGGKLISALSGATTWLVNIGKNIVQGLINGISSMAGALGSALVDLLPGPLKKFAGKLGLSSPSKVFKKFGEYVGQGFIEGVSGTSGDVTNAFGGLVDKLIDANEKGLAKLAKNTRARLLTISKTYEDTQNQLTNAVERLNNLKDEAQELRKGTKANVVATGDITGFEAPEDAEGNPLPLTFEMIRDGIAGAAQKAQAFNHVLGQLKTAGLNQTAIDQLVQAGPEAALESARLILKAGDDGIAQVNALHAQLGEAASNIGDKAADNMYAAAIQGAQGMVNGFQDSMAQIEAQMENIGRVLVKAIKKKLKIKSPSRIMAKLGFLTGIGFAQGMDATVHDVTKVSKAMVDAASGAIMRPDMSAAMKAARIDMARAMTKPIAVPTVAVGPTAATAIGGIPTPPVEVRVFIGETELTDIVRVEIGDTLAPLRTLTRQGAV